MGKQVVKADNHGEDVVILMSELEEIQKKGIIHLGAHQGEEVETYLNVGFEKIFLVEANPELCELLKEKFKNEPSVQVANCAVSDKSGEFEFHIHASNNGVESSSLLPMKDLSRIVSSMHTKKSIKVPCYTIPDLMNQFNLAAQDFNVIVSDIQGSDYFALKGAGDMLSGFDAVIAEIQVIELYENSVTEEKMDQLLEEQGFERHHSIYHELYDENGSFPAWGEAMYLKKK